MNSGELLTIILAARDGEELNGAEARALHAYIRELTDRYIDLIHGELDGERKSDPNTIIRQIAEDVAARL